MNNVLENYEPERAVRPTFLTVLCILTFLGSGLGLISNIYSYMNADAQAADMSKASHQIQQKKSGDQIEAKIVEGMASFTAENVRKSALGGSVSSVLCLVGAFMMWQLKRKGYYIYILGALVGAVVPFVIFGTNNMVAMIGSVAGAFFGLLFIVLYGLNLKSMK